MSLLQQFLFYYDSTNFYRCKGGHQESLETAQIQSSKALSSTKLPPVSCVITVRQGELEKEENVVRNITKSRKSLLLMKTHDVGVRTKHQEFFSSNSIITGCLNKHFTGVRTIKFQLSVVSVQNSIFFRYSRYQMLQPQTDSSLSDGFVTSLPAFQIRCRWLDAPRHF